MGSSQDDAGKYTLGHDVDIILAEGTEGTMHSDRPSCVVLCDAFGKDTALATL